MKTCNTQYFYKILNILKHTTLLGLKRFIKYKKIDANKK